MAYDPADLRLPPWLLRSLDVLVGLRLPLPAGWSLGMTRPGAVMLTSLLGVWAAAFYSGNNLLYLCGAMLVMIALGGLWQGFSVLRQCPDICAALPEWLEAGSPLVVRRATAGSGSITAKVQITGEGWQLQWWRGSAHAHVSGRLLAPQRGMLRTRRLRLSTAAPIGMWQLSHSISTSIDLPVLPRPVALPQQALAAVSSDPSRQLQDGDDFQELRGYVRGDAPARIHWRKAGGDSQQWRVKRFAQPEVRHVAESLTLDLRLPAHASMADFERLLGMAWYWLKSRWQQPLICKMIIGQQCFSPDDEDWPRSCLKALAEAQPQQQPPVARCGLLLTLVRE